MYTSQRGSSLRTGLEGGGGLLRGGVQEGRGGGDGSRGFVRLCDAVLIAVIADKLTL